jgi:hypothetical protein
MSLEENRPKTISCDTTGYKAIHPNIMTELRVVHDLRGQQPHVIFLSLDTDG